MIIQTSGNSKGPAGILCGREAWSVERYLFPFGFASDPQARSAVDAAARPLIVPGLLGDGFKLRAW